MMTWVRTHVATFDVAPKDTVKWNNVFAEHTEASSSYRALKDEGLYLFEVD